MSDSKHSKLSAKAADYVPSSLNRDFSGPLTTFPRNAAVGAFPSVTSMQSQMTHQPSTFIFNHAPPMPPQFQSTFAFMRPMFVDGLPLNPLHYQHRTEYPSADLPHQHFNANNKFFQPHHDRPRSAQISRPFQAAQPVSELNGTHSDAKPKRRKKKNKLAVETQNNDINKTFKNMSIANNVSVPAASQSYSDVLKRLPQKSPENVSELDVRADADDKVSSDELNEADVTEEFPALNTANNVKDNVNSNVSRRLSQRGVLRISSSALDNGNRTSRKLESFKLDLSALSSAHRQQHAMQLKPKTKNVAESSCSLKVQKKSVSLPDAPSSSAGDSPERKPKYSKLKKVILEERKKRQQHLPDAEDPDDHGDSTLNVETDTIEHDTENPSTEKIKADAFVAEVASPSAVPLDKSSPAISSAVPPVCNDDLSTALSGLSNDDAEAVCRRLHRRRFREYCNQVLGAALDDATYMLLTTLGGFQQRQYEQNPVKAKLRRRYVCGLREAVKHIQLGKARCIILAPNIERIPGKGGLDDMIGSIISQCASKSIPVIFALGRVALGRACSKPSPVSSVAIISPAGAEEKFKQTLELAQRAHESYSELVKMAVAEQMEQREQNAKQSGQTQTDKSSLSSHAVGSGDHVQFRPNQHMGHTRNASNISAISFISNVSAVSDASAGMRTTEQSANNLHSDNEDEDDVNPDDFEDEEDDDTEDKEPHNQTLTNQPRVIDSV